ncbi:MAG TPA: Holliday junction resolvase RuvX [Candidatus Pristimantibacillus sp.]|jgi:putative Holliday junction resolvase|nr:Holliday junction resolvase RuvX [Candidatus Pristimantibacillus sp.]
MQDPHSTLMALDVGERRIGVAIATASVRLAAPLTTIFRTETIMEDIEALIAQHDTKVLVVGLPRGLDGQHTAQTMAVEEFKAALEQYLPIPVFWQDEAVTSRQAEEELRARRKPYKKEDIDALSATYILDDFLRDHPEVFL